MRVFLHQHNSHFFRKLVSLSRFKKEFQR